MDGTDKTRGERNERGSERDDLLALIESLEKDNDALKQSVYHLSYLLSLRNDHSHYNDHNQLNITSHPTITTNTTTTNTSSITSNATNNTTNTTTNATTSNNTNSNTTTTNTTTVLSKEATNALTLAGIDVDTIFSRSRNPSNIDDDDNKAVTKRLLSLDYELTNHKGAVYCAEYSKCGKYIASGMPSSSSSILLPPLSCMYHHHHIIIASSSGGIDRTIRIWSNTYPFKEVNCLEGHSHLISR